MSRKPKRQVKLARASRALGSAREDAGDAIKRLGSAAEHVETEPEPEPAQ
jgi:hypothetical protein